MLKKTQEYIITGYVDNLDNGNILGVKYLGDDAKLNEIYSSGIVNMAIGIGQINVTQKRFNVVKKMKDIGFNFPPIISKDAIVNEEVLIGEGTQIFDGVVINSGSIIGKFSIINSKATVEHDCKIGNFCHIATSAVLSGGVEVDDFSMIGSNAVIVQYKKITSNCMVGAGAVVTKDITKEGVYVGNPARETR